jgi:hypothetical protein
VQGGSKRAVALVAVTLAVAASRRALAYRPFVSTDAAVADRGEVEIELGMAGFRGPHRSATIDVPELVVNLGVAPDVEFVGEFTLVNDLTHDANEEPTRFEDSGVSLKWVARDGVLQDESGVSLAVELKALLPTLRGQDRPGAQLVGILSDRRLGWTYHLNAGALVEPSGSDPGAVWGVIVERPLVGPLRAVAEINGESVRGGRPNNSALVGAVWSITAPAPLHELSFDIALRHGLSSAAQDWGGTAGVTFAFPWDLATTTEEVTP